MKNHFRRFFFFLAVLIVPALCQASVTILTNAVPNHTVTSGSDEQIYGTSSANQIILESGARAELINFRGQNIIKILAASDGFTVSRSGTIVTFQDGHGTLLKIPASTDQQTIDFVDQDPLTLSIHNVQVMLGDQVVTTAKSIINGFIIDSMAIDMCLDASTAQSIVGPSFGVKIRSENGDIVKYFELLLRDACVYSTDGIIIACYSDVAVSGGALVGFNATIDGVDYVYPRDKCN